LQYLKVVKGMVDMESQSVLTLPGTPREGSATMPPRRLTWREIADDLIERIKAGEYDRPDDPDEHGKIPSYRQVAALYAVSESTAHRAISRLTDRGWIESVPGRGNYVREEMRQQQ
jgi:DNA-binding GntR family transcriptional regulator